MIKDALSFLTNELNDYLKRRTNTNDDKVVLTSVATENGGVVIPEKSLGLSLMNIEEERVFKDQRHTIINDKGMTERINPEIKLNLYILISANFQSKGPTSSADYMEGLKQLSYVISFFQSRSVFTPDNSPAMANHDPDMLKLVVELYSYSFEQLYNFWTVVGTKYMPSVLYRVKLIRFQERLVFDSSPAIDKVRTQGNLKS